MSPTIKKKHSPGSLEVPKDGYISDLRLETSLDHVELQLILGGHGGDQENLTVRATVLEKEMVVTQVLGTAKETLKLHVPNAKVWCPETPFLYDLHLELMDSDLVIDEVESYFGLRTVGKHQDAEGHWRITLNGESCFHLGPLDQGWWPDGLLTAPTDQAMRSDIEFLKQSGFNMIRKHVKMEPRRSGGLLGYICTRMGCVPSLKLITASLPLKINFLFGMRPLDILWTFKTPMEKWRVFWCRVITIPPPLQLNSSLLKSSLFQKEPIMTLGPQKPWKKEGFQIFNPKNMG